MGSRREEQARLIVSRLAYMGDHAEQAAWLRHIDGFVWEKPEETRPPAINGFDRKVTQPLQPSRGWCDREDASRQEAEASSRPALGPPAVVPRVLAAHRLCRHRTHVDLDEKPSACSLVFNDSERIGDERHTDDPATFDEVGHIGDSLACGLPGEESKPAQGVEALERERELVHEELMREGEGTRERADHLAHSRSMICGDAGDARPGEGESW